MRPTSSNIVSVYRRASFDAFSYGINWYPNAHEFARSLDNPHRSAGIIAALSPMNHWDNNKRKAALFYSLGGYVPAVKGKPNGIGLSNNVAKANAIYAGEDAFDILKGDKVRAFYVSILDPYGDNVPVIDRHAFDIAVGKVTNDKARSILSNKGMYERFANAYRRAADIVGIPPAALQAITWEQWRNEKGVY